MIALFRPIEMLRTTYLTTRDGSGEVGHRMSLESDTCGRARDKGKKKSSHEIH